MVTEDLITALNKDRDGQAILSRLISGINSRTKPNTTVDADDELIISPGGQYAISTAGFLLKIGGNAANTPFDSTTLDPEATTSYVPDSRTPGGRAFEIEGGQIQLQLNVHRADRYLLVELLEGDGGEIISTTSTRTPLTTGAIDSRQVFITEVRSRFIKLNEGHRRNRYGLVVLFRATTPERAAQFAQTYRDNYALDFTTATEEIVSLTPGAGL